MCKTTREMDRETYISYNQKSKASSHDATNQGWNKVSLLKLMTGRF